MDFLRRGGKTKERVNCYFRFGRLLRTGGTVLKCQSDRAGRKEKKNKREENVR